LAAPAMPEARCTIVAASLTCALIDGIAELASGGRYGLDIGRGSARGRSGFSRLFAGGVRN